LNSYLDLFQGLDLIDASPDAGDLPQRVVDIVIVQRRQWRWRVAGAAIAVIAAGLLLALLPVWPDRHSPQGPSGHPRVTVESDPPARPPVVDVQRPEQISPSSVPETREKAIAKLTPAQLRALWSQLSANLALDDVHLEEPVGIAGGLRPITTSLATAFSVLRSTIPLGRSRVSEAADSAELPVNTPDGTQAA
jgi:hypothetical protein